MQDEKFISKYSQKIGGPVLELASGTGRLSKVILEEGLDYTGIDLSKEFNKVAQSRFKGKGEFFLDDMRDFNLKRKFKFEDLVEIIRKIESKNRFDQHYGTIGIRKFLTRKIILII